MFNYRKAFLYLLLIVMLSSCSKAKLKFTGNVSKPIYMLDDSNLNEFLEKNNIEAEYALLCGTDGTAAYVFRNAFSHINLEQEKNNWNSVTESLPDVCNIKKLSHISLFTKNMQYAIYVLNGTEQEEIITPFEAEISQYEFLGKSRKNGHNVRKYKFKKDFSFQTQSDSVLVLKNDGYEENIISENYDQIKLNDNYFICNQDTVVSIWTNQPKTNGYEFHEIIKKFVKEDRSLFIFLDSYGWEFRKHMNSIGYKGFLTNANLTPLKVPYPPKTLDSYWVFGSGKMWQTRDKKDEFFTDIVSDNSKGIIIEDNKSFYPSPIPQLLNLDKNKNGILDDDIFTTALKHIDDDLQFMLVHFHYLDDIGHNTGAYSEERINTFIESEKYIEKLTSEWNGSVYLFSDHGMHTESGSGKRHRGTKGKHYNGSAEDIIGVWGKLK